MILLNAYSTLRDAQLPDFPHRLIGLRDRRNAELVPHLDGFIGYVMHNGDGEMTVLRYQLYRHLQRVRQHYSVEIEPEHFDAYGQWVKRINAVSFLPDGSVRDTRGRVLSSDGEPPLEAEAELPFPADAHARLERHVAQLATLGLRVSASLPPVVGVDEVLMPDAREVMQRMQALFAVAARAESHGAGEMLSAAEIEARLPNAQAAMTPLEREFFRDPAPSPQVIINMTWRYEALATLQWALGLADDLPFPDAICNVQQAASLALASATPGGDVAPGLRPVGDILDALDLHFRLHWVIRQARLDEVPPPAGLIPGVVSERHHALNWLTSFEDKPWDEVDTPT